MLTIQASLQFDVIHKASALQDSQPVMTTAIRGAADKPSPPAINTTTNTLVNDVASEPVDVRLAVNQVQSQFQNVRRELEFSIDEKLQRVIIRVRDADTGDVIRQIPSEEFVRMARQMRETDSPHFLDASA